MRVLGLGWDTYATRWSSQADARIGTVEHLKKLLIEEIIVEELALQRLKQLPKEAAPPHYAPRELMRLGTSDADALEIQAQGHFSFEELKVKAEAARVPRRLPNTLNI